MKSYGPFPLKERAGIVAYAGTLIPPASVAVRDDLSGFWLDVTPDPPPEVDTQLTALVGWHQLQRSKARESAAAIAWGATPSTARRTDSKGFYLDPGRAGVSPRNQAKKYWDPFDA